MASIDDVIDALRADLVALLAPYQPSIPPSYTNTDPRAGTILATLVTSGHPIQVHVLQRLENQAAQVNVSIDKKSKPIAFTNPVEPTNIPDLTGSPGQGVVYLEIGRAAQDIIIDVWAPSRETRKAIADIVRDHLNDAYRMTMSPDNTVTLLRFVCDEDMDDEQIDSVYVRHTVYNADYTLTEEYDVTQVVQAIANLRNQQNQIEATQTSTTPNTTAPPAGTWSWNTKVDP